jgi:hypothetical protein
MDLELLLNYIFLLPVTLARPSPGKHQAPIAQLQHQHQATVRCPALTEGTRSGDGALGRAGW